MLRARAGRGPRMSVLLHVWHGCLAARCPPGYVKFRSEIFRNSSEKSSMSPLKCFTRLVK